MCLGVRDSHELLVGIQANEKRSRIGYASAPVQSIRCRAACGSDPDRANPRVCRRSAFLRTGGHDVYVPERR